MEGILVILTTDLFNSAPFLDEDRVFYLYSTVDEILLF